MSCQCASPELRWSGFFNRAVAISATMADLDDSDTIQPQHVAEAVGYRSLDRSIWA